MDKRQLAPALALSRLVVLIDSSPAFVDVAKQSAAYPELKHRVAELLEFVELYHTNVTRLPLLREHVRATRRELGLLIESIAATADLARYSAHPWVEKLHMPPRNLDHLRFAISARSMATIASEHAEDLTRFGMLPGRPDHVHQVAAQLDTLRMELLFMDEMISAGKQGYTYMMERARKTARVLFLQVRPFITEEMLIEWRQALYLGRSNRKALGSPSQLALPNAGTAPNDDHIGVIPLDAASPLSSAANE